MTALEMVALSLLIIVSLGLFFVEKKKRKDIDQAVRISNEETVEEFKKRYLVNSQRLLDALQDGVFAVSMDGQILRANKKTRRIFGDRPLENRSLEEALLQSEIIDPIRKSIAKKKPRQIRITLSKNSLPSLHTGQARESHWLIETFLVPPEDENDQAHFLVVMRNISDSVRTEQIRKDFVANASHELRTPLTIIGGYLENLLEDDLIDDRVMSRHALSIMQKHVERINRIVEDMLVISRLESGEASALKLSNFRLDECLNDVLERLESMINKQEATVDLKLENSKLEIEADRFYWTQLLFNLVENALKQNSTMPVKLAISTKINKDGDLVLKISDNGVGIPSADLPYIFNRFYRVEKHHSQERIKGTGLGLSIVKRAVEAHHGCISAESTPGVATTFTITTPINQNEAADRITCNSEAAHADSSVL